MKKIEKMNELKVGSILTYVNLIISTIIPLFYTPIMLEILGQSEYGLYSLSNSVIGYLTLLNFGLGSSVVRFVSKYRVSKEHDKIEGLLGLILFLFGIIGIIVCIVGFALTKGTGLFFGKGLTLDEINRMKILMVIMTLSTAISFPVSALSNVAIAYEKYIFRKLFDGFSSIMAPILNLIILYAGGASVGLALVGLVTQIIYAIVYIFYCKKVLNVVPRFHNMPFHMIREVMGFSIYMFLSSIIDMLYWATDKVLIGATWGTTFVAIYNIGGTFTSMLRNMSSAISGVFSTRINMMIFSKESMKKVSELFIRISRIQYYVISLILSGYIVFGRTFIYFWAGEKYMPAYYIGLLTMIPLSIPLLQNIGFAVIMAENKLKYRTIVYFIVALLNIIGTILALPQYGIIGAAVCTACAYVIGHGILMNIYYWKVIHLDIIGFWKNIIRLSFVPTIMIMGASVIFKMFEIKSLIIMLVCASIFSVIFLILSWIFSMNKYEKELVKEMVRRVA